MEYTLYVEDKPCQADDWSEKDFVQEIGEKKMCKPLFGNVAHFGSCWSVIFAAEGNTTSYSEGYGLFPEEEYPDLPLIEYNKTGTNNILAALEGPPSPDFPGKIGGNLAVYLWGIRSLAIPVRRTKCLS